LGHPSKFQRVSRLAFVTARTSLNGGQPNFAQRILGWYTIYIFSGALASCRVLPGANCSLCVQVLRSRILAAVLNGTRAVGVSKALRRGIFTRQSGHPVRYFAVELSSFSITRPHRRMRPLVTDRVALSVGLSVTQVSPAKTAKSIEMPLGLLSRIRPRNRVLDGGSRSLMVSG